MSDNAQLTRDILASEAHLTWYLGKVASRCRKMAFRLTVMIHIAMYFLNSLETAKSCTRHKEPFYTALGPFLI